MPNPPRPQKVTSACLFVGISSALLLFYVSGWLTSWNSQEIQGGLRDALDDADLAAVGSDRAGHDRRPAHRPDGVGHPARRRRRLRGVRRPRTPAVTGHAHRHRGPRGPRLRRSPVASSGCCPPPSRSFAVVQLWSRESRVWFAVVNGREVPAALVQVPADVPGAPRPLRHHDTERSGAESPVPPATPSPLRLIPGPHRPCGRSPSSRRSRPASPVRSGRSTWRSTRWPASR